MCELKKNLSETGHFHHQKVFFFCVYMYKIVDTGKETFENNDIEVIVDGIGTLWLNEKHMGKKLDHENLPVITNKYVPVCNKHKYELIDKPKKQLNRRF